MKILLRKVIINLEYFTREWINYRIPDFNSSLEIFINKKLELEELLRVHGHRDNYLQDQLCYVENRIWEIENKL